MLFHMLKPTIGDTFFGQILSPSPCRIVLNNSEGISGPSMRRKSQPLFSVSQLVVSTIVDLVSIEWALVTSLFC